MSTFTVSQQDNVGSGMGSVYLYTPSACDSDFHADVTTILSNTLLILVPCCSIAALLVIFCQFYELDTDQSNTLNRDQLLRHGEHGLSSIIVNRIFDVSDEMICVLLKQNLKF